MVEIVHLNRKHRPNNYFLVQPNTIMMKYAITTIALVLISFAVKSQHYGGINIMPLWTKSGIQDSYWTGVVKTEGYNFGYSFGYQGLIMADRRFSFAYGIQYTFKINEYKYKNPTSLQIRHMRMW